MSAEAAALIRSWPVGRYTATLTVPPIRPGRQSAVCIEWSPEQPKRLTPEEIAQYRKGRDDALRSLGVRTLVIEV